MTTTESIAALTALTADFDTLLRAPELLPEQSLPIPADLDTLIRTAEALIATAEQLERQEASHG